MGSSTDSKKGDTVEDVFVSDGEMGALMRSYDWSQTSLGAVKNWSQSLKTSIRIILGSRYPMFIWWGKELINFYNDAYIPILGKRHPDALGKSAYGIWTDIWHLVGPQALDVLNFGKPSWNEELLEIMERNGYPEETYFTFSYSPIGDENGGVGGVFCACTEDTRRVLDSRRLRTLRELGAETATALTVNDACSFSTSVLSKNPHDIPFALIYLLRTSQEVQLVSATLGIDETFLNKSVIDLTVAPELDFWSLQEVLATGESKVIEDLINRFETIQCRVWNSVLKRANVLPLKRPGQDILGFLIVGISPLRPFDDDYQGFFDLVAGQVTTAILSARAYQEERKRAEALAELDRAKTAFFNNVSHEFRTPLTLMLNPLEQVLTETLGVLNSEQREQLNIVQRNSNRLLKLVNTLLDFSRIEADKIQAVYEPTNLAAFTTELASVFRSAIEKAGLQLIVDCPPLSFPVYVDREMWEKIVLNLISNALKFTLKGEIAISLHPIDDKVELKVRDTGCGISPEELPRIFERFYRVRSTQARSYEGSGIGLALVQELVYLHSGTINVESVLGKETIFTVTLPTGSSHLPNNQISDKHTHVSTLNNVTSYVEEAQQWVEDSRDVINHVSTQYSSLILLVDDNADMRDYLKRLLSKQYQVISVANGTEALAAVEKQAPDLVLTDVMMPCLDGFQLLSVLRANPDTKGIPIILLSARAGEEAAIEALQAGADDYLIKPFSAQELLARVHSYLQMARLRNELSSNRMKDEFLATVTHELHAPLAAILGWTRLLRSNQLDGATEKRALDTIERNAKNQAKLIEDLLDISTILSGKVCLDNHLVNLTNIIKEEIYKISSDAEAKKIKIIQMLHDVETLHVTSAQQQDIYVLGDSSRLQKIFSKLLNNAIKFTPLGGSIKVHLFTVDSWATIEISNTGIGIGADFLPHVFKRFTQAEVPSRHSPGGLGLGLFIAHQLVELHRGTILAASDGQGLGTTFTVKLPFDNLK